MNIDRPKTAVLFGYHNIGCAGLETLHELGIRFQLVVTHEDDPGENHWFRSLAETARRLGIPTVTPERADDAETVARITQIAPDYLFSFYYRHMIPVRVLKLARIAALNLHGSLLPRYRGRCPVNWVILHQEQKTGVTLHYMTGKADAGDIVAQREITIAPRETPSTLFAKVEQEGVVLLREIFPDLARGELPRRKQDDSQATYFGGRRPEDGRIEWTQSAAAIDALVRAVTHPFPGAFTTHRGRKLFLWETQPVASPARRGVPGQLWFDGARVTVTTGERELELITVQSEGGAEVAARAWWKDAGTAGDILGQPTGAIQAAQGGGS